MDLEILKLYTQVASSILLNLVDRLQSVLLSTMEINHKTFKVERDAQIFHNCLHSLAKHRSNKVSKRSLVINLDYSFRIEANPVKPTVNQTFPMAQCVPECVPDALDVD